MFRSVGFLLASVLVAAAPARAQVYKWVDDNGVVNYSGEPPANRKSRVLDPKAVSVSVYAPPSPAVNPTSNEKALTERIERLERKLDAQRSAREDLAALEAAAIDTQYEQCLRDRRVDCDSQGIEAYAPYGQTVVVFRHPRHFRPPRPGKFGRPMFAPPGARHHPLTGAVRTSPSGIRRPSARTGDLL